MIYATWNDAWRNVSDKLSTRGTYAAGVGFTVVTDDFVKCDSVINRARNCCIPCYWDEARGRTIRGFPFIDLNEKGIVIGPVKIAKSRFWFTGQWRSCRGGHNDKRTRHVCHYYYVRGLDPGIARARRARSFCRRDDWIRHAGRIYFRAAILWMNGGARCQPNCRRALFAGW